MADQDDNKTIIDYFLANVKKMPNRRFFTQPMGGPDNIKYWTFSEVLTDAKKMAAYINSLDLPEKSQIAICSKNCSYWLIADLAVWLTGHVSVPVYPTLTADTTQYILEHSESKIVFIGKLDDAPWSEMKNGIPSDIECISFPLCPSDMSGIDQDVKKWDDIMSSSEPIDDSKIIKRNLDDMATIIYTSGSTGKPKGVMHSFRTIGAPTMGLIKLLHISSKDRYLTYLPVAHGMERWAGECVPFVTGQELYFAESLPTFVADLNRCQPTVFLSVPRLWTKFQAGVFTKMPEQKLNRLMSIPLIGFLVKRKILKGLGLSHVRYAGSGSAPIPAELLAWYRKLGLELLEGYGMTENFNYSHITRPGQVKVGHVGRPYDDVKQRIADDGELQVLSPGIMLGYYKNEEATKETITEDGWLRTGDKGTLDTDGALKITGRTKEIFKTSKGKYVAPAPIENLLINNQYVELACVGGRAYPQPHAILQLNDAGKKLAETEEGRTTIAKNLEEHMKNDVNKELDAHEHLQFCVIVKDEWLPENGFLTPTQKIKRAKIEETYDDNNDTWYGKKDKIQWFGDGW